MNKTRKKLALHRETLVNLEQVVLGGSISVTACPDYSCTYCYEQFCASGQPAHCQDTQAFSWCICTE